MIRFTVESVSPVNGWRAVRIENDGALDGAIVRISDGLTFSFKQLGVGDSITLRPDDVAYDGTTTVIASIERAPL